MADRLTSSLQESILTLLCFSDQYGAVAAGLLSAEHFEQPYRDVAERVLEFRKRFKRPPGKAHIDDLFDAVLENRKSTGRAEIFNHILNTVYSQAPGLNEEYVVKRVHSFIQRQTLKDAIVTAGDRLLNGEDGDDAPLEEAERILHGALKMRAGVGLGTGTFLSDKSNIRHVLEQDELGYNTGIKQLDIRGLQIRPKELTLMIAPKGAGKSWYCVHTGRHCLMQHAKVLDVTLEQNVYKRVGRYYQNFFGLSRRHKAVNLTRFNIDTVGRLLDFDIKKHDIEMTVRDPEANKWLTKKVDQWGARLGNLHIAEFPTDSLTTDGLESYMDSLELEHGFIPDVLEVDYPDLMKLDSRLEYRIALGKRYKELRGLAVRRNLALVAPTQTGRSGVGAKQVTSKSVAEDFSKNMTADNVLTYSQTKAEYTLGLARLYAAHARNEEDKFSVLISQAYEIGQFCVASSFMLPDYFDVVSKTAGPEEADDSEEGN